MKQIKGEMVKWRNRRDFAEKSLALLADKRRDLECRIRECDAALGDLEAELAERRAKGAADDA